MHDGGPLGQTRTSGRCFRQDGWVVKAVRADPQASTIVTQPRETRWSRAPLTPLLAQLPNQQGPRTAFTISAGRWAAPPSPTEGGTRPCQRT